VLYQRALSYIPGSYKLWYNFLRESKKFVKNNIHEYLNEEKQTDSQDFTKVVSDLFERALVYMSKMPKIWLDYAKYLSKVCNSLSLTREVYDRALSALPVTQHHLIWDQCLSWATTSLDDFTPTACHFYRRYIQFRPQDTEDFIDYLL
jgi:pre-mRNA-splicing factor SYF1